MQPLKYDREFVKPKFDELVEYKILKYTFLTPEFPSWIIYRGCGKNKRYVQMRRISKKYAYGKYHSKILKYIELSYYSESTGFNGAPKYILDNWFNIGVLQIYLNDKGKPIPQIPDRNGIKHLILVSFSDSNTEYRLTESYVKNMKSIKTIGYVKLDVNVIKKIPSVSLRGSSIPRTIINDFRYIKRLELTCHKINTNELSHLEELTLQHITIDDITPIGNIPKLSLKGSYISNLSGLNNNILKMECMSFGRDVERFGNIKNIELESISDMTDVELISHIPNIKLVKLNKITDVSSLKNAKYLCLEYLEKVTDVSKLSNVEHLELYMMHGLQEIKLICDMDELEISGCKNLTDIDICGKIRNITIRTWLGEASINLSVLGMYNPDIKYSTNTRKIIKNNTHNLWKQPKNIYTGPRMLDYVLLDKGDFRRINIRNANRLIWYENKKYMNMSHLSGKVGSIALENILGPSVLDSMNDYVQSWIHF